VHEFAEVTSMVGEMIQTIWTIQRNILIHSSFIAEADPDFYFVVGSSSARI